jgi:hypothetical protein
MTPPTKRSAGGKQARTTTEALAQALVKDPQQARMLRMGRSLGNDELQRRIESGNATRDELLVYMSNRLGAMRQAQVREENYGNDEMRETWMQMARAQHSDMHKPEPTRWGEAARGYEEAARALCRGHLGRGADLVKRAMEAEQRAFQRVGKQIDVEDLKPDAKGPAQHLEDVKEQQACAPRDVPAEIEALADKIQANSTEFPNVPGKGRVADPWWTEEEEEEDGEKPPGGGGAG